MTMPDQREVRFGDPELPKSLFGYDVIDFIGEGAGSVIYAVSSQQTSQLYALKHVVRRSEKDVRFVEQLEAELDVSRRFSHPGLRRSFELKVNKTLLRKVVDAALVMELFDGQPLEMLVPLPVERALDCFIQAATALDAMHQLGFVHCDLKPNNILLSSTGQTKVIDFGQACAIGTAKPRIQGTPDFIAPEQVRCEPVTVRTDVFNFGATMYWTLTGRKMPTLFTLKKAENSFLVDDQIPAPVAIDSRIPESLSNLVMECVRTSATRRPANLADVGHRLEIIQHALTRRQQRPVLSIA